MPQPELNESLAWVVIAARRPVTELPEPLLRQSLVGSLLQRVLESIFQLALAWACARPEQCQWVTEVLFGLPSFELASKVQVHNIALPLSPAWLWQLLLSQLSGALCVFVICVHSNQSGLSYFSAGQLGYK